MLDTALKYPTLDSLELITELKHSYQPYEKLHPVKTGDTVNILLHYPVQQKALAQNQAFAQSGSAAPYLNKILVVYFYSRHWGPTSLAHLKQLNAIRNEVKYHDGNLLIIDADGEQSNLQQTLWNNNFSLPVYADPGKQIAGLFKVYSEKSPAWSRYSNLEENVPLPATFVLDRFLRVVFDHNNEDISNNLPVQEVANAVYQANTYLAGRKSA